jgi:hypothetical protein
MTRITANHQSYTILILLIAGCAILAFIGATLACLSRAPNASDIADLALMSFHLTSAILVYTTAVFHPRVAYAIAASALLTTTFGMIYGPGILWKLHVQFIIIPFIPILWSRILATHKNSPTANRPSF